MIAFIFQNRAWYSNWKSREAVTKKQFIIDICSSL